MKIDFMIKAIDEAKKSGNDIPVGALIVKNNNIIALSHNEKEVKNDVTAHAEIVAIKIAAKKMNNWHLKDCELYVTLEPCPMCAWAIIQSGIKSVYFASYDTKYGAFGSILNLKSLANSTIEVKGGIMEAECDKILKDYFKKIRK